jgi:HPt (histidine-containing phosphotransfer) domain-containing protein
VDDLPPDIDELTEVDFSTGLERCRGQKDRFKKLLGFYVGDVDTWLGMLAGAIDGAELGMKDATINFHSMKSASATIGAMPLSQVAAELEAAGRREDAAFIKERQVRCYQIARGVRARVAEYIASEG